MANNNRGTLTSAQRAILTTILYSDIFSFPLTREELWHYLIAEKKISRDSFESGLQSLEKYLTHKDGYYCLLNREEIIIKRVKNKDEVVKKMQRARQVSEKLSAIPSLLFIGITGGLAAENVTPDDDIDFIIIVKKNTLFTSRLLILGVLESLGVRRYRNQQNTADTICVNLLFDESALSWFGSSKDRYTAREIAQILPLFERENYYQKFISANSWIYIFLPNVNEKRPLISTVSQQTVPQLIGYVFINPFFERVSRMVQMSWMKRHQTKETVTKHVLAFHTIDYRIKTLNQLRLKMRQFGLLTKF